MKRVSKKGAKIPVWVDFWLGSGTVVLKSEVPHGKGKRSVEGKLFGASSKRETG